MSKIIPAEHAEKNTLLKRLESAAKDRRKVMLSQKEVRLVLRALRRGRRPARRQRMELDARRRWAARHRPA